MPSLTTRFVATNHPTKGTALVPVGAPTPPADPLYPFTNALNRDRNVRWRIPSGADPSFFIVVDLNPGATFQAVGFMGMVRGTFPTQFYSWGYNTYPDPVIANLSVSAGTLNKIDRASGSFIVDKVNVGQRITGHANIPPGALVQGVTALQVTMNTSASGAIASFTGAFSDKTALTTATPMGGSASDVVAVLPAPVSFRYIQFDFVFAFDPFAVGKIIAASLADLGIAFSPNSTETLLLSRVTNRSADTSPRSTTVGPNRRRISYQFLKVAQATKGAVVAAAANPPFIILTPYSEAFEMELDGQSLQWSVAWGSPDLYDLTLNGESLA